MRGETLDENGGFTLAQLTLDANQPDPERPAPPIHLFTRRIGLLMLDVSSVVRTRWAVGQEGAPAGFSARDG